MPATLCTGSHTVIMLLENGYDVVIMDNLRNSFPKAYEHMQRIAGDMAPRMKFIKASISVNEQGHQATQHTAIPAGALLTCLAVVCHSNSTVLRYISVCAPCACALHVYMYACVYTYTCRVM